MDASQTAVFFCSYILDCLARTLGSTEPNLPIF